ncbi:MAG: signal peptide peptidase SppA [Syntrophales bacterium]
MRKIYFLAVIFILVLLTGCSGPRINLFGEEMKPLKEYTLEGTGSDKILLIPVNGIISDASRRSFMMTSPSIVQQIVSQLNKAEKDKHVKAVLLKINSPGGTITASDLLYHEIFAYKQRTGTKIVAAMMDMATSGAYYIVLPSDMIIAHPTTVTGSVGVIFIQPKVGGLMDKIGVGVDVQKHGKNKDMGSPFRVSTEEELKLMQKAVNDFGERFINLVQKHRNPQQSSLEEIATARIFLADDALRLGIVDKIGYLSDAVAESKKMAGIPDDARVVVYRRVEFPEDNYYNSAAVMTEDPKLAAINIELPDSLNLKTGFYYLWPGAIGAEQ